jgi:hypothetical protein
MVEHALPMYFWASMSMTTGYEVLAALEASVADWTVARQQNANSRVFLNILFFYIYTIT